MADKIKFALALVLLVAGVVGFYLLSEQAMVLRVLSVLVGCCALRCCGLENRAGQRFAVFAGETVAEAKKVVMAVPQGNVSDDRHRVRLRRDHGGLSVGY
jgi:preprotein translocase subunit SecE